jgi:hypothetical protein
MSNITSYSATPYPLTFKAVWTNENKHLDESLFEKATRYALFILNRLSTAIIVPSTRLSARNIEAINCRFETGWTHPVSAEEKLLKDNFRPVPIEVTTPDGIAIHGTFFKNTAATDSSPTVIFFQPNAIVSKHGAFDWILAQAALQEIPYNFVYFDYRGCGEKNNKPRSAKDLQLDGEGIYQFVKDKLRVPPKDIHFYGYSLGGGISANIKAMHKECTGNYVNERSFTAINEAMKNVLHRFIACAAGVISLLNWNIKAAKAIENLKGKTLIVHHPQDELMKKGASLYRHIFEQRAASSFPEISHLDLSTSNRTPDFIHGAPLSFFSNEKFDPGAEVAKFLFSSALSKNQRMIQIFRHSSLDFREKVYRVVARYDQNGGYYWGSGEDACHNRNGLSLSESQLAKAITLVKLRLDQVSLLQNRSFVEAL